MPINNGKSNHIQPTKAQGIPLLPGLSMEDLGLGNDSKTYHAGEYTLSIRSMPEKHEPIDAAAIDGTNVPNIVQVISAHKLYTLYVGAINASESGVRNRQAWNVLIDKLSEAFLEDASLTLSINSPGGAISELQVLHTIVEHAFKGSCQTLLDPIGASAGAILWMMGERRLVYLHSQMMVHQVAAGVHGQIYDMKSSIEGYVEPAKAWTDAYIEKLDLLTEEQKELYNLGKDIWITAKQLIERDVATHIILPDGTEVTVSEFKQAREELEQESKDKEAAAKEEKEESPKPKKKKAKKKAKKTTIVKDESKETTTE